MGRKFRSYFQQLPFRSQLLVGTSLVGSGLIAVVGSILIAVALAKIEPLVQADSSRQTEMVAKLSIDALIVGDRPALQTLVDGLKDLDAGLVTLKIADNDGHALAYWTANKPYEKIISSTQLISHGGHQFGTLTMEWSYAHFARPVLQAKIRSILVTFVALVAILILIGFLLQWYLINPLQYLEKKVRSVAGAPTDRMPRPQMVARELRAIDQSLDETANALAEKAQAEARMLEERSRAETAEASAKAKMDFLSLMSHEIRTPLGAMMGFGTLLESAELTADERENLDNLNQSGEFLVRVLNDLLDLSKIEADGVQLELLPTNLPKLLSELETMVKPLADSDGISLDVRCEGLSDDDILCDRHRLKQVLMNLVGNAIKFTEEGSVNICATAATDTVGDDSNLKVRFEVRDTGIGMTPDQCEHIFEPFSQADSTTTRRFGGTGLGLSVAREFVRKMGAELTVVSEPGIGSTFSFETSFPRTEKQEPQTRSRGERLLPGESSALRILIAEDEAVNRILFEKIFASMGHDVEFASDGQICIDLLSTGISYDAIFVDLHMPHVGGMEIARQLRQGQFGEAGQSVPLAIMSADILAEQEGRDIGIDAFISKPINQTELSAFLASVAPQKNNPRAGNRTRALIVEDQQLNRDLIAQILRRLDVETYIAADGIECIDFLLEEPEIDLILLDLRMPRMNGYTVIERIRNGSCGGTYTDIPIAIVSAEVFDTGAIEKLDVSAHISKPIDITSLTRFIESVKTDRQPLVLTS